MEARARVLTRSEERFKTSSFSRGSGVAVRLVNQYMSKEGDLLPAPPEKQLITVAHSWHRDDVICFTPEDWEAFINGVKNGEFDGKALAL